MFGQQTNHLQKYRFTFLFFVYLLLSMHFIQICSLWSNPPIFPILIMLRSVVSPIFIFSLSAFIRDRILSFICWPTHSVLPKLRYTFQSWFSSPKSYSAEYGPTQAIFAVHPVRVETHFSCDMHTLHTHRIFPNWLQKRSLLRHLQSLAMFLVGCWLWSMDRGRANLSTFIWVIALKLLFCSLKAAAETCFPPPLRVHSLIAPTEDIAEHKTCSKFQTWWHRMLSVFHTLWLATYDGSLLYREPRRDHTNTDNSHSFWTAVWRVFG